MATKEASDRPTEHATLLTASDLNVLNEKLDQLWASYLNFLDTYQKAQNDVSKHFSSGFLSLAQANFKAPSAGRGVRYGQDYFDGRMKAGRLASIAATESDQQMYPSTEVCIKLDDKPLSSDTEPAAATASSGDHTDGKEGSPPRQQPSPPVTPSDEKKKTDLSGLTLDESKEAEHAPNSVPKDPMKWFGILVPPELRRSQGSFIAALGDPVSGAANAARGMREVEAEIRKLRKAIRKAEREVDACA
ncbi:hypothetical protein K431DRAFT_281651 [Polychaeton citri CBS 116435]|uniref:Vacuolar ATPase assembly protein VMA22 n=1 Tax=Polychaeton citri CBS 116435 TaxID=1314669 RepID=A0A9P4QE15_9PEZI|nr:hypothetical protein K431DRAFT_281651 [Polychaeton citri CBS 116435]